MRLQHELAGPLELNLEVLRPDGDADVAFAGYTAIPGSPTDVALRDLAATALTNR
ncbi:hypothetical protein J2S40_004777 [Nocardioides luteus]|uniref:Uncharacterized protein n=1 Tax=Nocardioides luteus TaxID=1844 RepID=A0ABQ5T1V3_9ACTN|nr:hypothetical protein [Nocardioides luteus]GGR63816.1 hypothetical protein GCM10010197_33990 [Nocardioides luteus]GLJ70432.1 hypothetical protein GCM10017579_44680 [Nocardioides luteus]